MPPDHKLASAFPDHLSEPIDDAWSSALCPEALAAVARFAQGGPYSEIEPWLDLRVGFEAHLRLATGRKLFCSSAQGLAGFVDLGLPGSYPELDPEASRLAWRMGRALGARIPSMMAFERKRYAYPDLTKGYQTTQKGMCAFHGGSLFVEGAGLVEFDRGQIEEDAARSGRSPHGFEIDCSRAGSPLIEMVTLPMRLDPARAGQVVQAIRDLALHLGVSGGAPELAEFKTDVCVSIAPLGLPWGARVEIKGVALFESAAISATECARMLCSLLLSGRRARAATFRFDEGSALLEPMREKQDALYRFLPDGDLPMVAAVPPDAHEAIWDALEAPGAWIKASGLTRGALVDDPAAESLCGLCLLLGGPRERTEIEKMVLAVLSTLRLPVPREPRARLAMAEGLSWALASGAARRSALEAFQAGWSGFSFDEAAASSALASMPAASTDFEAELAPWLLSEPAAAEPWAHYVGGKDKSMGRLVGLARARWPGADAAAISALLASLRKLARSASTSSSAL